MADSHANQHVTESKNVKDTSSKNSEPDLEGGTLSGMSTPSQEKPGYQAPEQVTTDDTRQIITLPLSDPEHPNNWSKWKKIFVLSIGILTVIHSTLGSSLPSNAVPFIVQSYGMTDELQSVLPISTFLMGYVIAPFFCSPLSEHWGRKPIINISFILYTLFTMACAVAPTWATFLLFRFICGLAASAPLTTVGGMFADINADPTVRGNTMAIFMVATGVGPVIAPPLSGFVAENTTWRWAFGVTTIFAAVTLPFVLALPETYAPILLSRRAAKMRKETGNQNIIAQSDLQKKSFKYLLTVVMARPFRMLFQEWIVSSTCLYLALVYGIFYLYFEAYPIIFLGPTSVYQYSPGIAGLTFIPVSLGGILAGFAFFAWNGILARAQAKQKPWSQKEEFRRLPLALLGGPLFAASIFWLGWTAREDIFWLAPVASGLGFGMGFILIFMSLLNYLADAYMTYSASAQGIASTCRSLLGVLLPFASESMFRNLGIPWACSTLGFLSLALGAVPYLFIIYGERLRANSKFCQELHALHKKDLEEKERIEQSKEHV